MPLGQTVLDDLAAGVSHLGIGRRLLRRVDADAVLASVRAHVAGL